MKCFYHPTNDAAAVCKSCCRGLCHDCIAEVGLSCSCRNRCEEYVAAIVDQIERGRTVYQKTSAAYKWIGLLLTLLGAMVIALGGVALSLGASDELAIYAWSSIAGGVVLAVFSIPYLVAAKRLKQK